MFLWMRKLVALILVCAPLSSLTAEERGPLVLAATSLQESLSEAANRWAALRHPKPVISFAASSALARQIEAGAPADLFISADEEWMDELVGKGLIVPGSRASFLGNRLVIITQKTNGACLVIKHGFPLARALGTRRLAIADPASVPAGRYARESLIALGVWASVQDKLAPAENVRAALALVERGEAPYGIVYATDALASKSARTCGFFPDNSHKPITYPVARLKASRNKDAEAFRRYLVSPAGKAVFRRYGFTPR